MSYLSTSENVGFSGIPQNISDASCATQYKMAVEGVAGSDVNMFIHDSSGDEQTYVTHLNDNFFHTKFKIDPNELYTFHDSDVIAGEITVSHTEDAFIYTDNVDVKSKMIESPNKEVDLIDTLTNGDIKDEIKNEVISNGHYTSIAKTATYKDSKTTNTKVSKTKSHSQVTQESRINSVSEVRRPSVHSPKGGSVGTVHTPSVKTSINSVNSNNVKTVSAIKQTGQETFLDVYKREQGLVENGPAVNKTEDTKPTIKIPAPVKKTPSGKASQAKSRRGRGPAVHEALQRIPPQRAVPVLNRAWHAPGDELFACGPLDGRRPHCRQLDSSSSDDDYMPDFDPGWGPVCVEESAAESRGARLALRRGALRRHVARARAALRLAPSHTHHRALVALIKKQLNNQDSPCRLPTSTVNHLLAMRGMPTLLSLQERRQLRESGWSGGESGSVEHLMGNTCAEERCTEQPVPCGRYCLSHVTLAPEQRLYAACAAVFAGGIRCKQPLLPLQDQTPLCPEHAWKRDNYDKLSRDCRPKKAVRKRAWVAPVRPPRRAKRRRRPARARPEPPATTAAPQPPQALPAPPQSDQSLSEINVCSNSSTYDSSEDTAMGALSENEYIPVASNSHELEVEVEQVPHDDILDPAVLSQIPDEAFTEFFNQAEGGAPFAESSELAAALEAVLDERALDSIADCVFTAQPSHPSNPSHLSNQAANTKMQVPTSMTMEMSSSTPS
ncbi:uncharacterized protein LOC113519765 [Galleria mellonella]|uniref:Uncharacterized protein LOC113519765 n=1 Tax=Galleria mellonella TaxID=7137 RepID=A0A6J1WX63_GALME|nr:uncharacterized protein LOC113519765 [Galleria mellonella]XP_031769608.2 uncharacterized protein LOC113519765 [Galleria mellonella]